MSTTPQVTVLTVSYNVRQFLDESIQSIKRSRFDGGIEIIVVDNNSYDGTVDDLKAKHPDVTIIANESNYGFGKAVNQGAENSNGKYLMIINPDTIVEENTVATLVGYLEDNQDTGLVGPKILNPDGSLQKACKRSFPTLAVALPKILGLNRIFPGARWAGKYNLSYLDPDSIHSVDAVSGSCMVISRELFDEVGGFDPRYFMYGEDIDLCYKVHEKGLHVKYVPLTNILHFQGESVKSAPFDSINAFYDAMILFSEKHYSKGQNRITRLLIRTGIRIRQFIAFLGAVKGSLVSVFLDSLLVFTAFLLAIPITFREYEPLTLSKGLWPAILVPIWIIIGLILKVYSKYRLSYTRAVLMGLAGASVAATFTYFLVNQFGFSRKVFLLATLLVTVLLPGWRILVRSLIARGMLNPEKDRQNSLFNRKAAIIGTDPVGVKIMSRIRNRFDTGLDPVGFIDKKLEPQTMDLPGRFLGTTSDIRILVQKYRLKELVFASPELSREEVFILMDRTKDLGLTYRLVSTGQEILLGKSMALDLGDIAFIDIEYNLFKPFNRVFKRIFEFCFSLILLIITLPVQIILLLAGRLKKVRYWGEGGRTVTGWNFQMKNSILKHLPDLISVLTGRLRIVGVSLVETSDPDPGLLTAPGLTGLFRLRDQNTIRKDGNLIDRYYIQHQSFAFDIEILIKTLFI